MGLTSVSVIVPVFNERLNLPIFKESLFITLSHRDLTFEVIFVDDGSEDGTANILNLFAREDSRVRVITKKENRGKTAALLTGFSAARYDILVIMDADLSFESRDILRALELIQEADVVAGVRQTRDRIMAEGVIKFIASRIANHARNWLLSENFQDAGCGFKALRKKCVSSLVLEDGFDVFLLSLMKLRGFRIQEMPVKVFPRRFGKSHFGIWERLVVGLRGLRVMRKQRRQLSQQMRGGRGF